MQMTNLFTDADTIILSLALLDQIMDPIIIHFLKLVIKWLFAFCADIWLHCNIMLYRFIQPPAAGKIIAVIAVPGQDLTCYVASLAAVAMDIHRFIFWYLV